MSLAYPHKAPHAHGLHSWHYGTHNCAVGSANAQLFFWNMPSLCDKRIAPWSWVSTTKKGSRGPFQNGLFSSSGCAPAKNAEPLHLQGTCPQGLSWSDQDVWYDRLLFNTTGETSIASFLMTKLWQGELEHHIRKSRFTRTSRKAFIPQLVSIECHQEQIRQIWTKLATLCAYHQDPMPNRPDIHHTIGQSQNFPENIVLFQARNSDDPAVKVSCSLLSVNVQH